MAPPGQYQLTSSFLEMVASKIASIYCVPGIALHYGLDRLFHNVTLLDPSRLDFP